MQETKINVHVIESFTTSILVPWFDFIFKIVSWKYEMWEHSQSSVYWGKSLRLCLETNWLECYRLWRSFEGMSAMNHFPLFYPSIPPFLPSFLLFFDNRKKVSEFDSDQRYCVFQYWIRDLPASKGRNVRRKQFEGVINFQPEQDYGLCLLGCLQPFCEHGQFQIHCCNTYERS